ncbi:MAG TPA: MFS transporter [Methylomirabilota bacterium]|jgi:MFS family permease|nr:MFS transporter [Methylomirabilota bacterium]
MMASTRARRAVSTVFFVNGAVLASWVAQIPEVKARHAISDGRLGLVLLAMAAGSILALPLAGWLIGRWGSRLTTVIAAIGLCLALPWPISSPSALLAAVALAILGACNGLLDVSMNAQAVAVEERYRRPIMSSFHGLWSVGGVVGAVAASGAMAMHVAPRWHVLGVAVLSGALVALALRDLVPVRPSRGRPPSVFARPRATVIGLGLVGFGGLLTEGAVADWSAVYLRDALGAAPSLSAAGFGAFSLMMAVARFGGDRLRRRLGPRALLRGSSAIAAGGLGGALLIGAPIAAIVGFGLVGLGVANVIPVVFSAAGRIAGTSPGAALAAVATTGYCGYLAGPALIGLGAEVLGLPVALGLVSAVCGLIAVGAAQLPRRESQLAGRLLS